MNPEIIFFDLDATLYPEANGLWPAIRANIDEYMRTRVRIPEAQIAHLREHYYRQYGTTLRGLQTDYEVNPKEFLDFVHGLPLHQYLQPDPSLRALLRSIPRRRWLFTNSDRPHAERVTAALGIEDCFEGMVDVYALDPYCKPLPEAYHRALEIVGGAHPQNCALLDDSPHNLATAKSLGFFTILVGQNGSHPSAHRTLPDIHNLQTVAPEFWHNHPRGSSLR